MSKMERMFVAYAIAATGIPMVYSPLFLAQGVIGRLIIVIPLIVGSAWIFYKALKQKDTPQ